MAKTSQAELLKLLAAADKTHGFPAGTMQSVMQQETGGNAAYLDDPAKYHYAANAQGKRIAGHTGKESSAFWPFGILESTGAKPGYGVAPLKDKSLAEQVRFASEYLAGRSKQAGSLQAGLAGYGEGTAYAQQVASRLPGNQLAQNRASILAAPDHQVAQLAQAQGAAPVVVAQAPVQEAPQAVQIAAAPTAMDQQVAMAPTQSVDNPWAALGQAMPDQSNQVAMRPADIDFTNAVRPQPIPAVNQGNNDMQVAEAAQRMHSILKQFGLGRFSQEGERYQASIPEFSRTA